MKEKTYSNLLNKDWKPGLHALREALAEIAGPPLPVCRPIRVMSKAQYLWEIRMERVYRWRYWMGKTR